MRWNRCAVAAVLVLAVSGCAGPGEPTSYRMEALVPGGSPFHGVHGVRFDDDDNLYAVSVIGESVFRVDTETGAVETIVGPPEGMGDDLAIGSDGTFVWTAIEDGIVYARDRDGTIRRLMEDQRGVNAVSFSPDGQRLFVTLVFYGDALYELDVSGEEPPRLIVENLGGLNAFDVGQDGMIYGPVATQGRMIRVDPDTGEITTVSEDFGRAGAVKLVSAGTAYVLDNGAREIKQVDVRTGETTVAATIPEGGDNMDIDSEGRVVFSVSGDNALIQVDPATDEWRYVVEPSPLNSPGGLAVATENGTDTIILGDLFGGVRTIDGQTGAIEETPIQASQPSHIALTDEHLVVVGEPAGRIQLHDRQTFEELGRWSGFEWPSDALVAPNGDLIVAETGTGRLLRVTGPEATDRQVLADGLAGPAGLAWAAEDAVYVTEAEGGRLLRIDLTGAVSVEAEGLEQPEGIAVVDDGAVVVVEVGARQITRIEPMNAGRVVIASDLPIGLVNGPSLYRGVAVSPSAIYFNSDVENTVYRLTPEP